MFRELLNQCKIILELRPEGPLLIREALDDLDPTLPELQCVRTFTPFGRVPYVPGSSLKGALRAFSERVLRSDDPARGACSPGARACRGGNWRELCLACRTYGSPRLAGRVRFSDAMPWSSETAPQERAAAAGAVVVERRSGSPAGRDGGRAPYDLEAVVAGSFHAEVSLRNHALWQLGLVGLAVRELNSGALRLGSGKSRGFGGVKTSIKSIELEQWGRLAALEEVAGAPISGHGSGTPDRIPAPGPGENNGLFRRWRLEGAAASEWLLQPGLWSSLVARPEEGSR